MKKLFFAASLLLGLSVLFCSCDKEKGIDGSDSSSIVGVYVCQKAEVSFSKGSISFSDKTDWTEDQDYLYFDYEYDFRADGSVYVKMSYLEEANRGTYSVQDGYLRMRVDTDYFRYKIISNSGNTLKLELSDELLEFFNAFSPKIITKAMATYKRQ